MSKAELEKYIRKGVVATETPHPEVSAPRLGLHSDKDFGNMNFSMSWWAITEPFEMVAENHAHASNAHPIKNINIVNVPPYSTGSF